MDGFDELTRVKVIMATNRPDILDSALMRPGRLDRKVEIPLPNDSGRMDILKIHAAKLAKQGEIDYDAIVRLTDGFNGADLRNVCTEGGMHAIRDERDYVIEEDFLKAARALAETKKLESKMECVPIPFDTVLLVFSYHFDFRSHDDRTLVRLTLARMHADQQLLQVLSATPLHT